MPRSDPLRARTVQPAPYSHLLPGSDSLTFADFESGTALRPARTGSSQVVSANCRQRGSMDFTEQVVGQIPALLLLVTDHPKLVGH